MTRFVRIALWNLFQLLFAAAAVHAMGADGDTIIFEPSPGPSWRCGLANEELPGLELEHMQQRVAAGCERGSAKAYVVLVDLSNSRSAMSAEQMASDSEDQLPAGWKIDSRKYDVISLPGGRSAAYSRLVGKGDGFTFVSGQTPMVAISANLPMLFSDSSGKPRQFIAVFRVRSPIPAGPAQRKDAIADLDRTLRAWAGTAQSGGQPLSAHDFELAAYARTKGGGEAPPGASAVPSAAVRPSLNGNDRISAAVAAAVNGRATADDFAALEEAERRFPQTGLGAMAHALLEDGRRSSQQEEQQKILSSSLDSAKEQAIEVFSRFLIGTLERHDNAGMAAALNIAKSRGWTLRNASPAAVRAVAAAAFAHSLAPVPTGDAGFFELSSAALLPLVQNSVPVPAIEEIAQSDRSGWRLKDRHAPSKSRYVVRDERGLAILERQQGSETYRYRPLTNLLDVASAEMP